MPIEILMPALSPTMTEGNLLTWHKKEGDTVKAGDLLAEIETDKATMEVEAVDEGVLGKILVPEQTENVQVNTCIALLLEKGEAMDSLDSYVVVGNIQTQIAVEMGASRETVDETIVSFSESTLQQDRVFASPLARRLAKERGVDVASLVGTGPHGRIVKADVEKAGTSPVPTLKRSFNTSGPVDKPISSMRKVIARRLSESKQTVPHFYLNMDFQLDQLLATRKSLNENFRVKITVNDLIIKACAMALQDVPEANASWMGESVRYYKHSDVSVAVAIEEGLITPIVKHAEFKSIFEISTEMKELVQKAKNSKLRPEEFQGGSFSISNLGMYNITSFNAIVNPPQGAILAVGAGVQRPIIQEGQVRAATIMTATLSVDHRVIDGKVGAEFLNAIGKYVENPVLMLLGGMV